MQITCKITCKHLFVFYNKMIDSILCFATLHVALKNYMVIQIHNMQVPMIR